LSFHLDRYPAKIDFIVKEIIRQVKPPALLIGVSLSVKLKSQGFGAAGSRVH
jgi:hypothetical protein